MRLFQNSALYSGYLPRLRQLTSGLTTFGDMRDVFLKDRFGAPHFLLPILQGSPDSFFTNGDDLLLQRAWARENGLKTTTSAVDILLAQIEHHRAEVFYNLAPVTYDSAFVRRLPGCVKATVAWRAAPSPGADFGAYDLVVCNFPSILETYAGQGWRTAPFFPGHDPVMDEYAASTDRPVDVVFVGSFTRHHRRRAQLLETLAGIAANHSVVMHLDTSGLTDKAESWLGRLVLPSRYRRPEAIRKVAAKPVYGRELYRALSSARIVVNGAIDMAGNDRGNMRCFEALGCGALLVSDSGTYPDGMVAGKTILTYDSPLDAVRVIEEALASPARSTRVADRGHGMVTDIYSKSRQWHLFQQLPM